MLLIKEDTGEVIYTYDSIKGLVQGRVTFHQISDRELAFTLTGRTVPCFGNIHDLGIMLKALGNDLIEEATNPQPDAGSEELSEGQGFSLAEA